MNANHLTVRISLQIFGLFLQMLLTINYLFDMILTRRLNNFCCNNLISIRFHTYIPICVLANLEKCKENSAFSI